jgi:hypothetical protein
VWTRKKLIGKTKNDLCAVCPLLVPAPPFTRLTTSPAIAFFSFAVTCFYYGEFVISCTREGTAQISQSTYLYFCEQSVCVELFLLEIPLIKMRKK